MPCWRESSLRPASTPATVVGAAWCDNGPGWVGIELTDAAAVLAADPDPIAMTDLKVGLVGPYAADDAARLGAACEVRAFYADGRDYEEDPVTGSLNAALSPSGSSLPVACPASMSRAKAPAWAGPASCTFAPKRTRSGSAAMRSPSSPARSPSPEPDLVEPRVSQAGTGSSGIESAAGG
jgi:hypothetical protein